MHTTFPPLNWHCTLTENFIQTGQVEKVLKDWENQPFYSARKRLPTHFSAMKIFGQTSSMASRGASSRSFTSALCKSITHGVLNKLVSSIFSLTRLYRSSTNSCSADSNIPGHSEPTFTSFVFSSGMNQHRFQNCKACSGHWCRLPLKYYKRLQPSVHLLGLSYVHTELISLVEWQSMVFSSSLYWSQTDSFSKEVFQVFYLDSREVATATLRVHTSSLQLT